jgi:hypothetical protein
MIDTERALLRALEELDATVKTMATAQPKPDLGPLFDRVDALAQQLPKTSDPDLRHYLSRKSYEKARLLLQGRDAENVRGPCH